MTSQTTPLVLSESAGYAIDSYIWGVDKMFYGFAGLINQLYEDLATYLNISVSDAEVLTSRDFAVKNSFNGIIGWFYGMSKEFRNNSEFSAHIEYAYQHHIWMQRRIVDGGVDA